MTENLAPLFTPSVTEVLFNRFDDCWVEERGKLIPAKSPFINAHQYQQLAQSLLDAEQLSLSPRTPIIELIVRQQYRVAIIHPDLAMGSMAIAIRVLTPPNIPESWWASMTHQHGSALNGAITQHRNVLVVGGTGSGKTTLALGMLNRCHPDERIITIEDTPELNTQHPHHLRLVTRAPNSDGIGGVTMDQLVRASLRLRPDRLIIGEVRGPEIVPFLQSLNTGHRGGIGTLHANCARGAIQRLITLLLMHQPNLTECTAGRLIYQTIEMIVVMGRTSEGQRQIIDLKKVAGVEGNQVLLGSL